ncbi:hypothetical protein CONCODRAFT_3899 [Conidiobolus coronatus NRRL 28638]|uniref:Uncharacterized protein n=1 Tax=Conidiobolus coronatus (strain ATCC 28846 / CBS 209.66 / NRRL 28638) TaxID=796925 RepID=A0A137PE07_CONC2|nr:hypothetical protein CONCODRAFT_3899 [Conidiobolus coronatus NRRL 28638]|eukprot:KXN73227.1 hypothetical protein CONCODRAFT_3899 [Conidiobolus coronatus NRRL 28638]
MRLGTMAASKPMSFSPLLGMTKLSLSMIIDVSSTILSFVCLAGFTNKDSGTYIVKYEVVLGSIPGTPDLVRLTKPDKCIFQLIVYRDETLDRELPVVAIECKHRPMNHDKFSSNERYQLKRYMIAAGFPLGLLVSEFRVHKSSLILPTFSTLFSFYSGFLLDFYKDYLKITDQQLVPILPQIFKGIKSENSSDYKIFLTSIGGGNETYNKDYIFYPPTKPSGLLGKIDEFNSLFGDTNKYQLERECLKIFADHRQNLSSEKSSP